MIPQIVFFLEERSAREMLEGLLPKIVPPDTHVEYRVFEGKRDLDKRLAKHLLAWYQPNTRFVVLRDQNHSDCHTIKAGLTKQCAACGKPDALVRIACHELETFYLGDLAAVARAIGPQGLARHQNKAKYRNPDQLANAAQELKSIAPSYQKIASSRAIAPHLNITQNRSPSFNALVSGIQKLLREKPD